MCGGRERAATREARFFSVCLVCRRERARAVLANGSTVRARGLCACGQFDFSLTVPTSIATHMYIHCSLLRAHAAQNKKKMRLGSSR